MQEQTHHIRGLRRAHPENMTSQLHGRLSSQDRSARQDLDLNNMSITIYSSVNPFMGYQMSVYWRRSAAHPLERLEPPCYPDQPYRPS